MSKKRKDALEKIKNEILINMKIISKKSLFQEKSVKNYFSNKSHKKKC
jgi:hypothetical protein